MYSSVNYLHIIHYIPSTKTWTFVPFDCLHQLPSSDPHSLVLTNLISFSMSLILKYNLPKTLC